MSTNVGTISGLLKLRDEFTAALNKAAKEIEKTGARIQKVGTNVSNVGSALTKSITLPLAAIGVASVKMATDFESSFAGVRKTVNATEAEFAALSKGFRDLSKTIPVNVNDLNRIGEAAGQLGIAKGDILSFTRAMADLGNTTNLTADEAATATAQFQNIFGAAGKEVDRFGSTLVALGNDGASTEKAIIEMGLRIAGAGVQIGLSQGEVLAFASALSSVGIEAEAGGSAISKVMINIALAVSKGGTELTNFAKVSGMSVDQFKAAFEKDAAGAVNSFITGLGRLGDSGGNVILALDQMGISEIRMRDALLRAAGAGDLLTRSLDLQEKAWRENTALAKEAEQRYKTFESRLTIFWNKLKDVGIALGTSLLPVLQDLLDAMAPFVDKLAKGAEEFSKLSKGTKVAIVSFSALVASVGPALFVFGKLLTTWGQILVMAPRLAAAMRLVWASMMGPFGAILAGIAAISLAINKMINDWRQASEEAIALDIRLANLEGSANKFQRVISQGGGRISRTIFNQGMEDAKKLSTELDAAKKRLTDLVASQQEAAKRDPSLVNRFKKGIGVQEAQDEVNKLTVAYEKQKAALRGVVKVYDDIDSTLPPVIEGTRDLNLVSDELEKTIARLMKEFGESSRSLALQLKQQKEIRDIIKSTPYSQLDSALKKLNITHQVQVSILEDEARFSELGADKARELATALGNLTKKVLQTALANEELSEWLEEVNSKSISVSRALNDQADEASILNARIHDLLAGSETLTSTKEIDRQEQLNVLRSAGVSILELMGAEIVRSVEETQKLKRELEALVKLTSVKLEAEFELRVAGVGEIDARLREIEIQYLDFLRDLGSGSVNEGERIFAEMADKFGFTVEEIKGHLSTLLDVREAEQFRGAALTDRDIFKAQRASIERLMATINEQTGEALVSAEDGTAAIRSLTQRFWSDQLSSWSSALGFLADEFGGFFNHLNDLVNSIQRAQGFGQSVSGIATGMGASAGTASALGSVVTVIGVWKAIYDIGMGILKENKAKKFGQAGTITIEGGVTRTGISPGVGQVSSEAIRAIEDAIKAFEDALRISVDDLSEIGIKVRNDGKKIRAYVAGLMIGEFNDLTEAIQAALATALTSGGAAFSGMDDLIKEGLGSLPKTQDLEMILEFLGDLGDVVDIGLGPALVAMRDATRNFDQLRQLLIQVGTASDAVVQGFANLLIEGRMWQDLFDSITGRQKSQSEIMADKVRELALAKVELALRKAQIAQRILGIQADIAAIRAGRTLIGGTGGGGGSSNGGVMGVARAFSTAGQVITQTAIAVTSATVILSEGALAMIAALEAEMRSLEELQRLLDGLDIPDIGDIRIPGARGGRGDGGVGDFIKQKEFELDLSGLNEWQRAIAEITRLYEEQLEQAGRDIEQRTRLIELRERELALLAKQTKESLAERFQQFLGLVSPFDQVRKTAADLIKEIEDSPFGDERKARMIERVLEDVERQIEQMAREAAVGLFGSMLSDLEKFGATEELQNAVRMNMAVIEHVLKMEHYRTEIAILRAQRKLSDDAMKTLDEAFKFLEGVDPTKFLSGGEVGQEGPTKSGEIWNKKQEEINRAQEELAKKILDATRALENMEREALDPLTRDLIDLRDEFKPIFEVFGETERVLKAFGQQTEEIMRKHFGAVIDLINGLDTSELSPARTIDKFKVAQKNFDDAVSAVAAGDFRKLDEIPNLFEDMISFAREVSPLGSTRYRDLFNVARQDLLNLVSKTGLSIEQLTTTLPSGSSFGNLLVPTAFSQTPAPITVQQGTFEPIVVALGNHSDRQHVQLGTMSDQLSTIYNETRRVRQAVWELSERIAI